MSGDDRFSAERPPGLPGWPHWSVSKDGRMLTLHGRHLTAAGYRKAARAAAIVSLIVLIFPAWYFWGWQHMPPFFLRHAIDQAAAKAGIVSTPLQSEAAARYFPQRNGLQAATYTPWKWGCVALWLVAWVCLPLIRRIIAAIFRPFTWRRSAVTFTREKITIQRRWWRSWPFDRRAAEITFTALPLPRLQWLQLKTQRRGQVELGMIYAQTQVLYLQFGKSLAAVGEFADPADGAGFLHMSQAALNFTQQPAAMTRPTGRRF